ncbi:MAG TPA: hypothetical protein VK524_19245 [Polyangiaceae bacterium]|nr:hypothetical protein [Polyangiaceae bacterium]
MEDKLFWRRLESRKAACEQGNGDPGERAELTLALQSFEARLRERLSVRLALLGDSGHSSARPA